MPNIDALVQWASVHARTLTQVDRVVAENWTHAIASGLAHGYIEEGSDAHEHLMTMCYDTHENVAALSRAMARPPLVVVTRVHPAASTRTVSECLPVAAPSATARTAV